MPTPYLSISSSCAVDSVRTLLRTALSRTSLALARVLVPEQAALHARAYCSENSGLLPSLCFFALSSHSTRQLWCGRD